MFAYKHSHLEERRTVDVEQCNKVYEECFIDDFTSDIDLPECYKFSGYS